jgi:hypothetical protein
MLGSNCHLPQHRGVLSSLHTTLIDASLGVVVPAHAGRQRLYDVPDWAVGYFSWTHDGRRVVSPFGAAGAKVV